MTSHPRSLRTPTLRFALGTAPAILLALTLGALATPAAAGHDDATRGPQVDCNLHDGGPCTPACGFGYRRPYARRQFDRGFYAGQDIGYDLGFEAGRYGRRFCDIYPYRLRRHNQHYRQGVLEGYSSGYEEGFTEGRKQRRRHRGRGSRHWRW